MWKMPFLLGEGDVSSECLGTLRDVICREQKKSHWPGHQSSANLFQSVPTLDDLRWGSLCGKGWGALYQRYRSARKCTVIQCVFVCLHHLCARLHVCTHVYLHVCMNVHPCAGPALLGSKGEADQDNSLETATPKDLEKLPCFGKP